MAGFSSAGAAGVKGLSDIGTGVHAQSTSGNGAVARTASATSSALNAQNTGGGPAVTGISGSGDGATGVSSTGVGVRASGKTALSVQGPAVFSRSGTLTIPAGNTSATKTGVALTSASLVLVTAQNDVPGAVVRSAVPHVATASFTVHLAKAVTLGWFIVN